MNRLFNSDLFNADNIKIMQDTWNEETFEKTTSKGTARSHSLLKVIHEPFRCGVIDNLVSDPLSLLNLKRELIAKEPFYHKSNDLYEFFQSEDLKKTPLPSIQKLRAAIYSEEFVELVSRITGLELSNHSEKIDLSSHRYPPGGYLLCHDDDIEDNSSNERETTCRRIAFILYLVNENDSQTEWDTKKDGGSLQLFNMDINGNPLDVVGEVRPKWNRFAFFEVSPTSFHQVQEVLGKEERVSIRYYLSLYAMLFLMSSYC